MRGRKRRADNGRIMPSFLSPIMHTPTRVMAVAGVTLTQLIRMRLFMSLAVIAIGFMALQFLPYQEHMGVEYQGIGQLQFIQDVGLGCMWLVAMIFCVAATALLIPRDSEDRILYTILCKPVPRFDYLAGKALGVIIAMGIMLVVMDGMLSLLLYLREGSMAQEMRQALGENGYSAQEMTPYLEQLAAAGNSLDLQESILAMLLGFAVLTSFTLLISCFTSGTIVSMIFALGAYFIGMFQGQLFTGIAGASGRAGLNEGMLWVQRVFGVCIPDFSVFSLTDAAAAGQEIGFSLVGGLALVAGAYVVLHLLVATWIFSYKEF